MSGHVFVVGADLTRLSCDDVLVPTDRTLRVAPGWCALLPSELVAGRVGDDACVDLRWTGGERVLEVPGGGERRAWLVDTVDDEGRGLPWLLDGAREALAAVARREVDRPAHGRARRLV
ncbi:UNVERIFIED_ORG: SIR2 family protein, partial [Bacillus sp. AZ43]